ncbi:MAG: hypothetical protein KBG81_07750, partial [Moraxellaceae bacterium]|nr:hypothetical protein [Moraxellaceae bacterium]
MKRLLDRHRLVRALACVAWLLPAAASAQVLCVWDPMGAQGGGYNTMKDYVISARGWGPGVNITLKPYTDERVATEDFKAGQC